MPVATPAEAMQAEGVVQNITVAGVFAGIAPGDKGAEQGQGAAFRQAQPGRGLAEGETGFLARKLLQKVEDPGG
jgi:hypothetical protein